MGFRKSVIIRSLCGLVCLLFVCEYLVYYITLIKCSYPKLDTDKVDKTVEVTVDENALNIMLLADTHLLGPRRGHWFDKLRRYKEDCTKEWQMTRTFQTAMHLYPPDIVFVLGDLFDEGLWCSDAEFQNYVARFYKIFHVNNETTKLHVAVGNHDVGFHYGISPYLNKRFEQYLKATSVQLLTMKGVHFVIVNSMAMEGDGCFLCRPAVLKLNQISKKLKCSKEAEKCPKSMQLEQFSRPILLQHFPLYRESDAECNEPDEAPIDLKLQKNRERWEVISKESSELLLNLLNPRLVVTGHTHHGCRRYHAAYDSYEFTLPSFNWRNKDNPSFILATISPNNFSISKCYVPRESTVICLYIAGFISILIYLVLNLRTSTRKRSLFKIH